MLFSWDWLCLVRAGKQGKNKGNSLGEKEKQRLIMGLPARIVSLSDKTDGFQHMFAEIYGYDLNGNAGWFLIDPTRNIKGTVLSGHSDTNTARNQYASKAGEIDHL